jgi:hypothetical protein
VIVASKLGEHAPQSAYLMDRYRPVADVPLPGHNWAVRIIHLLTALVALELAGAALGYFSPDRWALLGVLAGVLLIPTTALLGFVQLRHARRDK